MHCVIVPSQEGAYEQTIMQAVSRQSDRQATASELEVIRQQRAIEEQIHTSRIATNVKRNIEKMQALVAERENIIEAAKARLAQASSDQHKTVPALTVAHTTTTTTSTQICTTPSANVNTHAQAAQTSNSSSSNATGIVSGHRIIRNGICLQLLDVNEPNDEQPIGPDLSLSPRVE